ncbi:MAG: NAD(P)/FAD-dependent oxidoreductase [Cyclobacteriaceae bacterium]
MTDVIIIGGGLAGLFNSILLSRAGLSVILFEKKSYPFHRVCGEYISNEVIPFLESHSLFPVDFEPTHIDELQLSSTRGKNFTQRLDLGGFGISRYQYDHWLSKRAIESGVDLRENITVISTEFKEDHFSVETKSGNCHSSKIVIGSYGKRSKLDQTLDRAFLRKKSPYVGVKYHLRTDLPSNRISLHNFNGGYCGISQIEDQKFNLCYLTHREPLRKFGSIGAFEKAVLSRNPFLKDLLDNAEFLFEKPEVINEITFEKQEPLYDHIFMCGDAAGMITPLCGNGMAMAIHSSKILSENIVQAFDETSFDRSRLEKNYADAWSRQFSTRLWAGQKIQHLFGSGRSSGIGVSIGKYLRPVSKFLISQTHGQPFN